LQPRNSHNALKLAESLNTLNCERRAVEKSFLDKIHLRLQTNRTSSWGCAGKAGPGSGISKPDVQFVPEIVVDSILDIRSSPQLSSKRTIHRNLMEPVILNQAFRQKTFTYSSGFLGKNIRRMTPKSGNESSGAGISAIQFKVVSPLPVALKYGNWSIDCAGISGKEIASHKFLLKMPYFPCNRP
jgi:hypothetical protein